MILAGGEGFRMGMPKGLLEVSGQPILEYLLDRVGWPGPTWLVTSPGREHPPGCLRFDRELIDPEPGLGPLRGLLTALENLAAPMLVAMTVDMPELRLEHLQMLESRLRDEPRLAGVMYSRGIDGTDQPEPFPLALRASAAEPVRGRLQSRQRSVHGLLACPAFITIPAPLNWDARMWTNLNEPDDWRRFVSTVQPQT